MKVGLQFGKYNSEKICKILDMGEKINYTWLKMII